MTTEAGKARRSAPLKTPNPLSDKKVRELSGALNLLLADAFVHLGAHVDVMGLNIGEISPQLIDDTLALYPRLGFKKAFTEALAEVGRKKPFTAIGTGIGDIARRLVPGFEVPNVCDLLLNAPFES